MSEHQLNLILWLTTWYSVNNKALNVAGAVVAISGEVFTENGFIVALSCMGCIKRQINLTFEKQKVTS